VLLEPTDSDAELGGLFVEPGLWRRGTGPVLVRACVAPARRESARRIVVIVFPRPGRSCLRGRLSANVRRGPGARMEQA
jgi:GNAT superfamily N-acetyltransferase